jgi:hypothetical protein
LNEKRKNFISNEEICPVPSDQKGYRNEQTGTKGGTKKREPGHVD